VGGAGVGVEGAVDLADAGADADSDDHLFCMFDS